MSCPAVCGAGGASGARVRTLRGAVREEVTDGEVGEKREEVGDPWPWDIDVAFVPPSLPLVSAGTVLGCNGSKIPKRLD